MSTSNRAIIQALYNIYKKGQLNDTVFEFALKSPTHLVSQFNVDMPYEISGESYGNKFKVYIAFGWVKVLQNLWATPGMKIETIKMLRIIASENPQNIVLFQSGITNSRDIKHSNLPQIALSHAKFACEKLCGSCF